MNPIHLLPTLLALLTMEPLLAQDTGLKRRTPERRVIEPRVPIVPKAAPTDKASQTPSELIPFRVEPGPLDEALARVREDLLASPLGGVNVILDPGIRDLEVPLLELRVSAAKDVIILLAQSVGVNAEPVIGGTDHQQVIGWRISGPNQAPAVRPRTITPPDPPQPESTTHVYPLWMLGKSPDRIETILGETLEKTFKTAGLKVEPEQIAIHPDTLLLVVRGEFEVHRLTEALLESFVTNLDRLKPEKVPADEGATRALEEKFADAERVRLEAEARLHEQRAQSEIEMTKAALRLEEARRRIEQLERELSTWKEQAAEPKLQQEKD